MKAFTSPGSFSKSLSRSCPTLKDLWKLELITDCTTYAYYNVPESIYNELVQAQSPGK
ncbi:MAG: KTSC domain-containing protein, partial [Oscillospiraceae bacterium]|nr:KTSC domain-containing protein [Oscillospiraceae bacterium]